MTAESVAVSVEREAGGAGEDGTTPYYVRKIDVGTRYKALDDGPATNALADVAGPDGRIHIGMEIDSLIRDVAPDLYGYFGAFLREDMNNALRQVRLARSKGHDGSHVHVVIDRTARTVEVHDVDTMGMPVSVFRDVYAVLGRSGNLDGRESGQKGIGRMAYLAASDTKIVETRARETNERYGFIVRGGKVFEPIPDDMLSIDWFGSRTSVCVDKKHDIDELPDYATEVARMSKVPVYLTTRGFRADVEMRKIGGNKRVACRCKDAVHIQTDDFEFWGCHSCDPADRSEPCRTYLIGIPIEVHGVPKYDGLFSRTTLNILDERKYEPTTSRDWLTESASERVWGAVAKALKERLSKIECRLERVTDEVPRLVVMLTHRNVAGMSSKERHYFDYFDVASASVRQAASVMRSDYRALVKTRKSEFKTGTIPRAMHPKTHMSGTYHTNTIAWCTMSQLVREADGRDIWYAPGDSIKWRRAAFATVDAGKGIVIFPKEEEEWADLERIGIRRIRDSALSVPSRNGSQMAKVVYATESTMKCAETLGADDICVPRSPGVGNLHKVCVEMRRNGCRLDHLGIFPWFAEADESEAQPFDAMRAQVDSTTYETSAGPMTGREILDTPPEEMAICPAGNEYVAAMCDNRVVAGAAGEGRTAVYRTEDADGDRLWLAYGYEHDGTIPPIVNEDLLLRHSLLALGVPAQMAGANDHEDAVPMIGELRMLSSTAQKAAYMRIRGTWSWGRYGSSGDMSMGRTAAYMSRKDSRLDEIGLYMDMIRDGNDSGQADRATDGLEITHEWHSLLMAIAFGHVAAHYTRQHAVRLWHSSMHEERVYSSVKDVGRLYREVLRHVFGKDTTVRAYADGGGAGGDLMIEANIKAVAGSDDNDDSGGRRSIPFRKKGGGNGGVHIGGALSRILFGGGPLQTVEVVDANTVRVCACVGTLAARKDDDDSGDGEISRPCYY